MGQWWSGTGTDYRPPKAPPPIERAKTAMKDKLDGTARCACGCRQTATAFRGGKMYNPRCVGRGSGWDKSGLPQDRTPPGKHGGKRWVPNE